MKHLTTLITIITLFWTIPAYSDDILSVDFGDGKSVFGGELITLNDLVTDRKLHDGRNKIVEIKVYAQSRRRNFRGYVQLLDNYQKVIAEGILVNSYISLPVYDRQSQATYLHFEHDVFLNRLEIVTQRPLSSVTPGITPGLTPKQVRPGRNILEVGNFVKANYKKEVKKFAIPHGGFSKINFRVQIREQQGVIVNSIIVHSRTRELTRKTIGRRLTNGNNIFSIRVPNEATDITVSFDHGQGSSVQILLAR